MHRRAAGSGQHYTVIVADGRHSSLPTIEILWFVDYFYFFVSFRIEETVCPLLFLLAGIPNSFRADNGGKRSARARSRTRGSQLVVAILENWLSSTACQWWNLIDRSCTTRDAVVSLSLSLSLRVQTPSPPKKLTE